MRTIMNCENDNTEAIGEWAARCGAVLSGCPSDEDFEWLERHIADLSSLAQWLEHRRRQQKQDADDPDLREVSRMKVTRRATWRSVLARGLRQTVHHARARERAGVLREIAAILYNPDTLGNLEFAIFSAETMPPRWAQLQAETGRGIEPRLFHLQSGKRIRLWTPADAGCNRPTISTCVEGDEIEVCVAGLHGDIGEQVDAVLTSFRTDNVYAAFPTMPSAAGRSKAVNAKSWKRCRAAAEASLEESKAVLVDDDGWCTFRLRVPAASHPLADRVLAVVIGYERRPSRG